MNAARGLAACVLAVALACPALPPEPDLPDLRRGRASAEAGDVAAAERDLVPLARLGYLDAQLALAALYARSQERPTLEKALHWYRIAARRDPAATVPLSRVLLKLDDPSTFAEAEKFLRAADRKGDPRALAALLEFYTDHPERDPRGTVGALVARAEKQRGPEVESALIRWYRRHTGDARIAAALAARCARALARVPECYADLARHHRARGERAALARLTADGVRAHRRGALPAPALERMAWSLVQESVPGEPLPELAFPLLRRVMDASPTALVRVARLQVEYPHLDPDGNPERLLRTALAQGSPEAALALGRLYLNGTRVPADPQRAERYLRQAAAAEPAAHYFLGRIYQRGHLGEADPERAAAHLLAAARGGYARADYALARLFSDDRGVRPNRVYAWAFASLAAGSGLAEGPALAAQLRASMTPGERRDAEALRGREQARRAAAGAHPAPQQAALSAEHRR